MSTKQLEVVASQGASWKATMEIEQAAASKAIYALESIEVQDAQLHSALQGERTPERRQSVLAIPLSVRPGHAWGALSILSPSDRNLTRWEINQLRTFTDQAGLAMCNCELFQQERQRADAMEVLQESITRISSQLDEKETLDMIIKGAMQLIGMDTGVVHLVDEFHKTVIHSYEIPEGFGFPAPRFPKREGLTWTIVKSGDMVISPDISRDERVHPGMFDKKVGSSIGAPLRAEGKIIGVLYLCGSRPREFTDYEKTLLATLIEHAATAIAHARLFRERSERAERLQWLHEITAIITAGASDPERVLQLIVDGLSGMFRNASCAIRLYNSTVDAFTPRVATGVLTGAMNAPPRPEGISRYVTKTKTPHYLEEHAVTIPLMGMPALRKEILKLGIKTAAILPLLSKENAIGILYLVLTSSYQFSANDKQILELFAHQAAIAIQNARLVEELSSLNDRLREVSYEAVDLIGAASYHDLSSKVLNVVTQRLAAHTALYRSQRDHPDSMKLAGCVPQSFQSRIKTTCNSGASPLKPGMSARENPFIWMACRSRNGKVEGRLLAQRLDTPAQPFGEADRLCLLILANAVGHALQKLNENWALQAADIIESRTLKTDSEG